MRWLLAVGEWKRLGWWEIRNEGEAGRFGALYCFWLLDRD